MIRIVKVNLFIGRRVRHPPIYLGVMAEPGLMHFPAKEATIIKWSEGSNPSHPAIKNKRRKKMTENERIAILKDRYNKLKESPKNIKCPGVLRKLERQLRNAGSLDT